jgi:16S rRNA (uracil1498-N3)-methyltransferase
VPEVRPTIGFQSWIATPSTLARWTLSPGSTPIAAMPPPAGPLELLVGPEGGLSERERDLALSRGCESVSLGHRVLRTETAPLATLAAIHALWGDFR